MMLKKMRGFIFEGGVINLNSCTRGSGGPFCIPCPEGTYKAGEGTFECIPCPCKRSISNSTYAASSLMDCNCLLESNIFIRNHVFRIFVIFLVLVTLLSLIVFMTSIKNKYDEKTIFTTWRFKASDIPSSYGRIFVAGDNLPESPWKILVLEPHLHPHFDIRHWKKFKKSFNQTLRWPQMFIYLLTIIKYFNFSPGYLFILRIFKVTMTNKMISLLEKQKYYKLFKGNYALNQNSNTKLKIKPWTLKWTTASDLSSLSLNVIRLDSSKKKTMNWDVVFPLSFRISRLSI